MRKTLMLTLALIAGAMGPAIAADMPIKAPPLFVTTSGSGWYAGLGTEAAVAQSSVSGTNLFASGLVGGNLVAAGGAVKGVVGYIYGGATRWYRLEASVAYQNISGTQSATGASASVSSRWSATQEVDISVEWLKSIMAVVGNLGVNFPTFSPVLPSNVAVAATPRQYVGVGAREFGISGSFGAAGGTTWSASPMIKSGFLWQTLGANGQPNGGALDAYAWVSFPMRGVSFNNILGNGGAPATIGSGVNMGTQYGIGLNYAFGIGGRG